MRNTASLPILHTGNGWAVTFNGAPVFGRFTVPTRAIARKLRAKLVASFNWKRISFAGGVVSGSTSARETLRALLNETLRHGALVREREASGRARAIHPSHRLGQVAA